MLQAIRAVRELCDLPIIAQMTIMTDGNTVFGTTPESFTESLDEAGQTSLVLTAALDRNHS
jgi:methionine synthase I (cobalamin-dependent)